MADYRDYFQTDRKHGLEWHRMIMTEADEICAKAFYAQQRRTAAAKGATDVNLSKRGWCGYLAEQVLDAWLTEKGIWHEWNNDPDRLDPWDLYVPPHYIDSKCCAASTEPLLHYGCNVKKTQVDNPKVTMYVFGRYIYPDREMILVGGSEKKRFMNLDGKGDDPISREVGDIVNQMKVEEPFWEQPIENQTPLLELISGTPCVACNHWNGFMEGQLCGPCWFKAKKPALTAVK